MKNVFIRPALALALLAGLSLSGCKDALDITPQQSIDAATAFDTEQKVSAAVVGLYAQLDSPNLYGTDLILVPELLGGNGYINWNGTFGNYRQIRAHTQTALLSNAQAIWQQAYATINQANVILANLTPVQNEDTRNQLEGESLFIRGTLYFELVRLYAQQYKAGGGNTQAGVPINLVGNTTVEQADTQSKLPRATVEEVYAQVISDLTAAIDKLPEQNITRASKYSAQAMLARVYLQQGDYTAARAAADDVITNSGASLAGSVAAIFSNRNSAESLFEIQQNDQNNAGTGNSGLATFFAGYSPNGDQGILYGRGDVTVLPAFAKLYEESDVRGTDNRTAITTQKLIYVGDGNNKTGILRTLKWRTYGQNIPVIRLAEMYLIRAECDIRADDMESALEDVNLIRQRSGASQLEMVSLSDVLLERQLELAFEGFRIHDLKRTDRPIGTLAATDPRLVLPIPQREINNNTNLTQNEGYN